MWEKNICEKYMWKYMWEKYMWEYMWEIYVKNTCKK